MGLHFCSSTASLGISGCAAPSDTGKQRPAATDAMDFFVYLRGPQATRRLQGLAPNPTLTSLPEEEWHALYCVG